MVTVKNKSVTIQETFKRHTPNEKYENFVTTHMEEAAAECIPIKPTATWESLVGRKKQEKNFKVSLLKKRNLTNAMQKLKKAQGELANTYQKEQNTFKAKLVKLEIW